MASARLASREASDFVEEVRRLVAVQERLVSEFARVCEELERIRSLYSTSEERDLTLRGFAARNRKKGSVEWWSSDSAAIHLGFVDPHTGKPALAAFRQWVKRARVRTPTNPWPLPVYRLGGRTRFRRVDLDRCVDMM